MVELVVSPSGVVKNAFLVFLVGVGVGMWLHSRITHTEIFPRSVIPTTPVSGRPYYYESVE
jgi:hypothetical protein